MAGLDVLGKRQSVSRAAARAKLVQEADPLAQAVAARMIEQLNAIPEIGGLSALKGINLPAAYAGDQRSMKAAQRAISEAETGLQSPGRRKLLKQAAATAARSAVPDTLADGLGAKALQGLAKQTAEVAIPDASIQAAVWAAVQRELLKAAGPSARKAKQVNQADFEELMRTRYQAKLDEQDLIDNAEDYFNPRGWLQSRVYPDTVDRLAGFPEGTTARYFEKLYPGYAKRSKSAFAQDIIDDLAEQHQVALYYVESSPKELWRNVDIPKDVKITKEEKSRLLDAAADYFGVDAAEVTDAMLHERAIADRARQHYADIFSPGKEFPEEVRKYFNFPEAESRVDDAMDYFNATD
jgi:hypothetical protein